MTKIRYKVLTNNCCSPYHHHQYEIGKWYEEKYVGRPGKYGCVHGLYAGPVESLLHRGIYRASESVWRCEVDGKSAGDPPLKECWKRMRVLNPMTDKQVRALARRHHNRLGFQLEECLYPHNPFRQNPGKPGPEVIELLGHWASVWAYVGSLFPNIEEWKYVDHEPGVYPFQAGADLWRAGYVPSFDGGKWRLHAGPEMEVVWEG